MRKEQLLYTRMYVLCALFATWIAIGAWMKIPIPMIPFTLQFLFANLAGLLLGRKYGAFAVGLYVLIGLAGFPVFTGGGGISYVLQPTFGYLIGFIIGAWVAGAIVERAKVLTTKTWLMAGFSNLAVVYLFGFCYYYWIANFYLGTPIGFWLLVWFGVILAIPGDILLCLLSAPIAKRLYSFVQKGRG